MGNLGPASTPGRTVRDGPLGEVEAWFVGRGVPHLIDGYSARRDVLTRSLPVLSLIFVAEVLGATELDWPWWANLLALAGGLAALLGIWAGVNRFRGRRPLARPDDVGAVEVADVEAGGVRGRPRTEQVRGLLRQPDGGVARDGVELLHEARHTLRVAPELLHRHSLTPNVGTWETWVPRAPQVARCVTGPWARSRPGSSAGASRT